MKTCITEGGFDKLLEEGDYTRVNKKAGKYDGIAISLPGTIDPDTGMISQGGALQYNNNVNMIELLESRYHVPVSIENDDDGDNNISEIPSDTPTPEENVMMNERQRAVREAINNLSDEYREIIVYSDINQLSYDEISKVLKCPVGTIKSRLNRARNALRKILSEKRELF